MPQITRWVVDASKALTQSGGHPTLMTIVVISLLAALKYLGGQTRMHLHQLLLSLPLLGRWSRDTNTAALSAGIPLTQALPYAAQTCRNEVFRRATKQLTGPVSYTHLTLPTIYSV